MKKLVAVGVIFLFLGLAISPSINANVSKESELVEITTEICGLGGGQHTVQLTKEEVKKVEALFKSINEKYLTNIQTKPYSNSIHPVNDVLIGPGLWIILFILDCLLKISNFIDFLIELYKDGELLTTVIEFFSIIIYLMVTVPIVWIIVILIMIVNKILHPDNKLSFKTIFE